VSGDVSKAAEAQGIVDAAIKNYGRLDILVNNSGVYEFAPIEAVTEFLCLVENLQISVFALNVNL
jgi:3-oxoacyl-[acyl-carrier protein] reductase